MYSEQPALLPAPRQPLLRVAVLGAPLPGGLDYFAPPGVEVAQLEPGRRVSVPFRNSQRVGIILELPEQGECPREKLKAAFALLDDAPLLPETLNQLVRWAAEYYYYPLGQAFATALPGLLNQGRAAELPDLPGWRLTPAGRELDPESIPPHYHRRRALLALLRDNEAGVGNADIQLLHGQVRSVLKRMADQGWVEACTLPRGLEIPPEQSELEPSPELNPAQAEAVAGICARLDGFGGYLLDGVTGSGKTEVYLRIIQQVLARGRQSLVLVPEINLTPQMLNRFRRRFSQPIAVLHSGLSERERLATWLRARAGLVPIVIGTRSAVWTPLARPGLIIVDEEHDQSYKQQDHFHYSARDLAVMRGHREKLPVVLGSATPSLESLHNVAQGRYHLLHLPERAGGAAHPRTRLVDMRARKPRLGFSPSLLEAMNQRLERGQQTLIFINRRGYAPVLMCHHCGWVADCEHCTAHLTYHQGRHKLLCHHCGAVEPHPGQCPACGEAELNLLGQGTERMEQALGELFPQAKVARMDSDTIRSRRALEKLLEQIQAGEADILVGTQMLTKGHHFPNVTLVGVINADAGLFGVDFRAGERFAQTLVQVSGRAGRADNPGEVLIQTWHPEHPLLNLLLQQGYPAFARAALAERRAAELPPYAHLALLRAEAVVADQVTAFLRQAKGLAEQCASPDLQLWGPVPAPLERRAGRYRGQLLLQATRRETLRGLLRQWLPQLSPPPEIRWSLDVDPQEML